MSVTAAVSLKGGSGKTTTAINLGAALALKGKRTLLVDLDPQASLTYVLRPEEPAVIPTIADFLLDSRSLGEVILPTGRENLDLCASDSRLWQFNQDSSQIKRTARRFAEALKTQRRKYDQVIIDCPPALTPLARLALHTSEWSLTPTQPSPMGLDALERFLDQIEEERRHGYHEAKLLGVLVTNANPYLRVTVESCLRLKKIFHKRLFHTIVRQSVRLVEAPGLRRTIFEHDPHGVGAENYNKLCKEFLHRMG
jgi:chromosome partitioning protein